LGKFASADFRLNNLFDGGGVNGFVNTPACLLAESPAGSAPPAASRSPKKQDARVAALSYLNAANKLESLFVVGHFLES
jgi:hypothetical protein